MSAADSLAHDVVVASGERVASSTRVSFGWTACAGVMLLVCAAPYETLRPLVTLPGQTLTTVEAALLLVCAACAVAIALERRWPRVPVVDAALWTGFVGAALLAAALTPNFRGNALHMAARMGVAAVVWGLTLCGAADARRRRLLVSAVVVAGCAAALLVLADFAGWSAVERVLRAFRSGVAVVGAQIRASGPFQYPTIASMFLEITFAVGLGLLSASRERSTRTVAALAMVLFLMVQAIVVTFTRSGLITVVLSMLVVGTAHLRAHGWDRAAKAGAVLAAAIVVSVLSSRSAETLLLRWTSETQGRWFSAAIEVPEQIALDTRTPLDVPIIITNAGRATWDSDAAEPIKLSYHWVAVDSDEVIAWEGIRTLFDAPVAPGETVSLVAQVGGPGRPGHFRLMWDLEQEHRLWFSTEPDAEPAFSDGVVTGPVTSTRIGNGPRRIPRAAQRPGRLVLWSAAWRMWRDRPWTGVGLDNYRLLFGRYTGRGGADTRVHSNNMYVEVFAGAGLIGGFAFLALCGRAARQSYTAWRTSSLGTGIAAAVGAIAVHGLSDSFLSFTATYILIAVTLGLATACAQEAEGRHAHRI